MSMLERLSDARGTIEGKVVAIALALLLVMPVVSVTAFAEPEDHHESQDPVKVEEYTPGEDPVPIEKTAEASVPSVQAEESQEPAEEPVDSIEIEGRFNYDIVANGTDKYYGYPVVFLQNRKDQQFEIPFELRASNPDNIVPAVEGKYFQGWARDKSSSTAEFAGAFYTIPGDYVVNEKDHAFELYPIYSTVPLQYVTVDSADYEGYYDGEAHGITVTVTQCPEGAQPSVCYRVPGVSDWSDWSEEAPLFTDATIGGPVTVEFEVKCAGCELVRGSQTVNIKPLPLTVATASRSKVYDGTPLTAEGIPVVLGISSELGDGYFKYLDAGESYVQLISGENAKVTATGEVTDVDTVDPYYVGYVVEWGSNVTPENYKIDTKVLGTLQVTPAPLTVETNSAEKTYDGTPLTAEGISVTGFVNGETAPYAATGKRVEVGKAANTYEIAWDDAGATAKRGNYTVTKEDLGTLEVTKGAFPVKAEGYQGTFDGQHHGVTVEAPEGATIEYQVNGKPSDNRFINAGEVEVTYTVTHKNLNYAPITGTVTVSIAPAPVTIRVDDASKTVGAADPEITGAIEGEVAGFPLTGVTYQRRTNAQAVGTYVDDLTVVFDVDPNYDVTVIDGDFTINPLAAPGTVPGDGGPVDAIVNFLATPIIGGTPAVDGPMASIADDGTPMASIDDEGTPLGAFDHPLCWIHYYILLGIIITAIYGGGVIARRLNHSRKVKSYEDDARGASRSKDRAASPAAAKAQPVMAERADA